MYLRGIRGATTVASNAAAEIISATKELLSQLISENNLNAVDMASIFFSTTKDLNAEFPAKAARELGLNQVPLLCLNEIDVPASLGKCIRILIHVNTMKTQNEIKHVYLKEAVRLRPDIKA